MLPFRYFADPDTGVQLVVRRDIDDSATFYVGKTGMRIWRASERYVHEGATPGLWTAAGRIYLPNGHDWEQALRRLVPAGFVPIDEPHDA